MGLMVWLLVIGVPCFFYFLEQADEKKVAESEFRKRTSEYTEEFMRDLFCLLDPEEIQDYSEKPDYARFNSFSPKELKYVPKKKFFVFRFLFRKYLNFILDKNFTDSEIALDAKETIVEYYKALLSLNEKQKQIEVSSGVKITSHRQQNNLRSAQSSVAYDLQKMRDFEVKFIGLVGKIARSDYAVLNKSKDQDVGNYGEPLSKNLREIAS